MKVRVKQIISLVLVMALAGVSATAQIRRRAYTGTTASVRQLIRQIEIRTGTFRNTLDTTLDRSRYDGTRAEDDINRFVSDFQNSVSNLHERFDQGVSTSADARVVIDRASVIEDFVMRNNLNVRVRNDWFMLRRDLNDLARAYGITGVRAVRAGVNGPIGPVGVGQGVGIGVGASNRLTGTYQLDAQRSDDPARAADDVTRNLPYNQRQRVRDRLTGMLESPDRLAIERNGLQVTLASSRSPQISFTADGRETVAQSPSGRTVRSTARLVGDQLVVSSTGDRNNDFTVTFDPIDNGQRLSVTRRVYTESISRPVSLVSVYNKVSQVADFNLYNGPQVGGNVAVGTASGDFVIPDGTTVIGTLNENLSSATAHDGDPFTLNVQQPGEYQGAVINGHLSNVRRSGTLTGRSEMTLNYDSIRMPNGNSYRFAGITQNIRAFGDTSVRVDTEGTVQDQNQTSRTEQRAAIGGVAGAVLGAIIGGAKGAAIGAVLGAGGGAGSIYVQGRNDLQLNTGTEVTIRASSPNR